MTRPPSRQPAFRALPSSQVTSPPFSSLVPFPTPRPDPVVNGVPDSALHRTHPGLQQATATGMPAGARSQTPTGALIGHLVARGSYSRSPPFSRFPARSASLPAARSGTGAFSLPASTARPDASAFKPGSVALQLLRARCLPRFLRLVFRTLLELF